MNEIIQSLIDIHEQKKAAVLCIITESSGSTPRKAGSKMLVYPDGSIKGSVGGGSIEHTVIEEAMKLMHSQQVKTCEYNLGEDLGMQCGGHTNVYFEAINASPRLIIFGAGHIGKILSEMAMPFGFDIIMVDNREELLDQNWAGATLIVKDFVQAYQEIDFRKNDFVVVTTYKHEYDQAIVAYISSQPHAYLGMMASKRKAALAQKIWKESGISQDNIDKIFSPIGLKMQCETPKEIALSILAQLIDELNKLRKAE